MDIRLLIVAGIITIIGYITLVTWRYFMGQWQWTIFYPGKYIFPKRIKTYIRPSVLLEYKTQDITGLVILEDRVEDDLDKLKIHRVDVTKFAINARIKFNKEECFKYFLFLKQAFLISQPSEQNGLRSEIILAQQDLKTLNKEFSKLYLKQGLSNNDRSIILAEILYRVLLEVKEKPYGFDVYTMIRKTSVISKYEDLIKKVHDEGSLNTFIYLFKTSNGGIYTKDSDAVFGKAILFRIYVLLVTKWL